MDIFKIRRKSDGQFVGIGRTGYVPMVWTRHTPYEHRGRVFKRLGDLKNHIRRAAYGNDYEVVVYRTQEVGTREIAEML